MKRYVIIGGDAAGMSAAMELVRNRDEENTVITTIEKGSIYSYAQCGLPYVIEGAIEHEDHLIARDVETFRNQYGIDARTNSEVTSIDCEEKVAYVQGEDTQETVAYDTLLIATGASPIVPDIPGKDLKGTHTLKTIPDLQNLQKELPDVSHITIVGGGYIGLELTEALVTQGFDICLIQRNEQVAPGMDHQLVEHLHEEARFHNVELRLSEQIEAVQGTTRVQSVKTDKGEIPTDLVVFATGIEPNTAFLSDCSISRSEQGAIYVNEYLQTNVPDVYAAGDCALQYHRLKEEADYVPLGTHANKQGRIAGMNMSEQLPLRRYEGMTGTSIFRFFNLDVAMTGLTKEEATAIGHDVETVLYTGSHIAGYFEEKKPIHLNLVYDRTSDQFLGAQIVGKGVDKRIDVAATALYSKLTCEDIENLDLAYAPPYNGVWDPLQQALRRRKR
ncbi:NADH dehydrogenase [Bacillaceae bacterium JMAK1]|nr:NADH dehydrogenase [Bacillaceae bacterium JMAK1]